MRLKYVLQYKKKTQRWYQWGKPFDEANARPLTVSVVYACKNYRWNVGNRLWYIFVLVRELFVEFIVWRPTFTICNFNAIWHVVCKSNIWPCVLQSWQFIVHLSPTCEPTSIHFQRTNDEWKMSLHLSSLSVVSVCRNYLISCSNVWLFWPLLSDLALHPLSIHLSRRRFWHTSCPLEAAIFSYTIYLLCQLPETIIYTF